MSPGAQSYESQTADLAPGSVQCKADPAAGAAALGARRAVEPSGWLEWLFCASISSGVFVLSYAALGMNSWERANARRLLEALRMRRSSGED